MLQENAIMVADKKKMEQVLESARVYIDRDYLMNLENPQNTVMPPHSTPPSSIRILQLKKIVYNTESVQSRLLSVFHTLSGVSNACFLMICGRRERADLYLGLQSDESASLAGNALCSSICGNFPGTEFEQLNAEQCVAILSALEGNGQERNSTVVSVSQVPSLREESQETPLTVQGIEHFIDAMKGQSYVAIIFAIPHSRTDAEAIRSNLENLYSSLSSLEKLSYQYGENMSTTEQISLTSNISESITNSIMTGYSYGTMQNSGTSRGGAPSIHTSLGSLGLGFGLQRGSFQGTSTQVSQSGNTGQSVQKGIQRGQSKSMGESTGQSKSMSIVQTNKMVSSLLQRLDKQITRIQECETYGLWECCAFFTAPAPDVVLVAANIYKSISCGTNSGTERFYMNMWDDRNPSGVSRVLQSLKTVRMPVFQLSSGVLCNTGSIVSGSELPILMNFPLRSVCGVTVMHMASFGRDVFRMDNTGIVKRTMKIGNVFHMGRVEDTPVKLNIDSLSAHTLVTGTTGVGKSTLMAMVLSALHDIGVKILVVEPVKGEYKDLLGGIPQLQVFSTNPRKNRMLRINPFEFRKEIHVLTHIDRLIEVFSVCWPLYAAQPALLRECVEEAYVQTGWDLSNSIYVQEGMVKYPDFRLLLRIVPKIIERSHFVGESRGTYEGALLTRIAMLTHGIFGQVFNSSAGLQDEELFEQDAIIDLSEVGSQETISLLMGILVVRIREYRTGKNRPMNQALHHVMVLEEAHNIFQRNIQNSVEGGQSVAGKSVQMLSQCIAEMRGYGQGIFIVDQSPSEIDLSSIRNTATKIVMRQPEAADQKAMAESLSLSAEQTAELSRLPERVALVYQTGWIEPVMVHMNNSREKYRMENTDVVSYDDIRAVRKFYVQILMGMEQSHVFDIGILHKATSEIENFSSSKKQDYLALFEAFYREYQYVQNDFDRANTRIPFFSRLFTELMSCEDLFRLCMLPIPRKGATKPYSKDEIFQKDCMKWKIQVMQMLDQYLLPMSMPEKERLLQMLLLNDDTQRRQISVHNTLFGRIAD